MEGLLAKIQEIENTMALYGSKLVITFAVIVFGLILIKLINQGLRPVLRKLPISPHRGATLRNIISVLMSSALVAFTAIALGLDSKLVLQFLAILTLAAIGLIVLFRPLIPTLPFRVGNTIKAGDLMGKVEATTLLNTRLRTFDGATVFVPNRKILNEVVINYHYTPIRRFSLNINIQYDQDLMKAKQLLESIMVKDPQVDSTPRPVVHVMDLNKGYIELEGRGWTDYLKRFVVTRELLEKTKLRFEQEGITLALPQMQIHYTSADMPHSYMEK